MFASRCRAAGRAGVADIAFTDRHGGVCTGHYASLDLTGARPGADESLAENRRRVCEALGVESFQAMRQVHGAAVVVVGEPPGADSVGRDLPRCDGLVTARPGVALCVRAADCVPLVLADPDAGVVAVAHAGRPGVLAGIVPAVLEAMRRLGAEDVHAWIGPHVCGGCYEVPADMRRDVAAVEPAAYGWTRWGTPSVDIGAGVEAQLARGGCRDIVQAGACTRENDDFFSYRRQGPDSGRGAGLVVLRSQ